MLRVEGFTLPPSGTILYAAYPMQPSSNRHETVGDWRQTVNDRRPPQRVTVPKAAEILGVTPDAVRSRLRRGKLQREEEDGTVYVLLEGDGHDDQPTAEDRQETVGDRHETVEATVAEEVLRDQVTHLREQLAEEREARRRADHIIAQLTQANATLARRVPELETARAPRESPMSASNDSGSTWSTEEEQRSWWRRFFGF